ncbi:hypothetical protein L6164_008515 [Bauhinia variegata]|uniref:Uncharacterized protein n=1 Tax=Bauhinia variegata TaxID=167791 RepID=A0ACB9PI44_BAUVA|nr:hypothetical protein L6164_008515 [Bauhinia variegata]
MKLVAILSLFLVALTLFNHTQGDPTWCPKSLTFPGSCGEDGDYQCFLDFLAKFGASAMPKDCTCKNNQPNSRLCTCLVVCG